MVLILNECMKMNDGYSLEGVRDILKLFTNADKSTVKQLVKAKNNIAFDITFHSNIKRLTGTTVTLLDYVETLNWVMDSFANLASARESLVVNINLLLLDHRTLKSSEVQLYQDGLLSFITQCEKYNEEVDSFYNAVHELNENVDPKNTLTTLHVGSGTAPVFGNFFKTFSKTDWIGTLDKNVAVIEKALPRITRRIGSPEKDVGFLVSLVTIGNTLTKTQRMELGAIKANYINCSKGLLIALGKERRLIDGMNRVIDLLLSEFKTKVIEE